MVTQRVGVAGNGTGNRPEMYGERRKTYEKKDKNTLCIVMHGNDCRAGWMRRKKRRGRQEG